MESIKSRQSILAVALFALLYLGASGCGDGGGGAGPGPFYVALGNSLSVGFQPDAQGVGHVTDEGYADQLHQALLPNFPGLQLVKFGCPGETTVTMLEGGICDYDKGSQIDQAVDFILANKDKIALITIDIGVNDLLNSSCLNLDVSPPQADPVCIQNLIRGPIVSNLSLIMSTIFQAVNQDTPVIGMNYYNPFLAVAITPNCGAPCLQFAGLSDALAKGFNGALTQVYGLFGYPTADVYTKFNSGDFTPVPTASIGLPSPPFPPQIPLNVGLICALTFNCTPPPQGPDIHARPTGYGLIAEAFLDIINAAP